MFLYENALFGPVGLLSESWQKLHDYRLIGEDRVGKEKAVVIWATPKQELGQPHPYVLKIAWDQKSLRNYKEIEEFAKSQDAEPSITAFSEYGYEKNGLRFPSRNYSEQGYVFSSGPKVANAKISVVYKKYKFFTVETEVGFDE